MTAVDAAAWWDLEAADKGKGLISSAWDLQHAWIPGLVPGCYGSHPTHTECSVEAIAGSSSLLNVTQAAGNGDYA